QSSAGGEHRRVANLIAKLGVHLAGAGHQQDSQHLMVVSGQRKCVKSLPAGRSTDHRVCVAICALHLVNYRRQLLRRDIGSRTISREQVIRRKSCAPLSFVEHDAGSGWRIEGGQEALVETNPTDDVELVAYLGNRAHRQQSKLRTRGNFYLFEKWRTRNGLARQWFGIAEFRRPLR